MQNKYSVTFSKRFKKDFKKINNNDKKILKKIVNKLANDEVLEEKYKDHALKGNYAQKTIKLGLKFASLLLLFKSKSVCKFSVVFLPFYKPCKPHKKQ
ncbi:type II toxin-antitoxin system mRNA interferase toxin, RelE/StbE family [Campylobacter jejuni]|nr:type II toxin-antitoxin system mRNA interferase toxin, RelE/StbE family [Campylobacter jejuni]